MALIELTIDGRAERVRDAPTHRTLLEHLRATGRVGSKEGCAEGDCGACTVALLAPRADGSAGYRAVNSCLLPLAAAAGAEVVTVEGVAEGDDLHPVQAAMAQGGGSQCGYCTPGFVMSLFAAYYDPERPLGDAAVEGNLCRCTGYLPIRRAAASLGAPTEGDRHLAPLAPPISGAPEIDIAVDGGRFVRPTDLRRALELLAENPEARAIAGATDLGVEITKLRRRFPLLVSLEAIPELQGIEEDERGIRIGAALPLSHLEARLQGRFPALDEMLRWFAAQQIKNRATLGGNLGTASPIGDLAPVLLALDADIEAVGLAGRRTIAVADLFTGYRTTALEPAELIATVHIPTAATPGSVRRISTSYKVGKRGTDDISIVAAAYRVELDADGRVLEARLAYGGVAATPLRALEVEAALIGSPWSGATATATAERLRGAFTPLDDHRGSADYRRRLTGNLFLKLFHESEPAGVGA
jgi:xanthine dehydrogenase small subunit